MTDDYAELLYPFFLKIGKLRLNLPDVAELSEHQSQLFELLSPPPRSAPCLFYGEATPVPRGAVLVSEVNPEEFKSGQPPSVFLGLRYFLCALADEVFCRSPWGEVWTEQKIELKLFGTNHRAEWLWPQAIQSWHQHDVRSTVKLCVLYGFPVQYHSDFLKRHGWTNLGVLSGKKN